MDNFLMNCLFCHNDITNYRLTGLTKPAGTFYCHHCTQIHNLYKVLISIDVNRAPLEASIQIDQQYLFRVDYYSNKTYLLSREIWRKEETIVTAENTTITPSTTHNKFKTYLLFS